MCRMIGFVSCTSDLPGAVHVTQVSFLRPLRCCLSPETDLVFLDMFAGMVPLIPQWNKHD